MTEKEAIEILKCNYPSECFEQLREAVDMAIEALQKFDAIATDIISRQDAIDLAYDCEDEFGKDVAFRLAYYIKQLPSVVMQ